MEWNEKIEIPQIDMPDEVTHTNQPEIEILSPHPIVPMPEANTEQGQPKQAIGFKPNR